MRQNCNLEVSENATTYINETSHTTLGDLINEMSNLFQKLIDISDEEIEESLNVAMLLSSYKEFLKGLTEQRDTLLLHA